MSRWLSYLRSASFTTANVVAYAATDGRFVLLEGRLRGRKFHNWALRYRHEPEEFLRPTTQAQIIALIRRSRRLRVVGSGHSFNSGIVSDQVLVSLDDYAGLVRFDAATHQVTVRGGTRVRDVVKIMLDRGLAFTALPSHDAQSIAGILSTDVHGTGRDWGFVSQSVVGLTVIDGTGQVHRCTPDDDLFRAAIGGVGAVGIITEVTVQGVPRFAIRQRTRIEEVAQVRQTLPQLLAGHDHLSLYLFPYADHCQVNTWDRSTEPTTPGGELKEFINISADALLAAWVGDLIAHTGLLRLARHWSRLGYLIRRGTQLILESDNAHNRTMYHLHQELEFTVPYERTFEICDALLALYQQMYADRPLPYLLLEVRFTPADHDLSLIGPGTGRRSTWIDLIINDTEGFERFYAAAVELIKSVSGRPHLGKYTEGFDADDLQQLYGERFRQFRQLVAQHDPDGKFSNSFTRRMLGDPVAAAGDRVA